MTITVRNNTLRAGIGVSLLLLVGFFAALVDVFLYHMPGTGFLELIRSPGGRLVEMIGLLFLLVFSFSAGLLLQIFFRQTVSTEMFFFIFFVISLSLESAKVLQLVILAQNAPTYYEIVVTRIVYFGRFFGVFCLFTSGLYATGIDYQRFEVVLGISLLLAFTLAFSIPISSESFLPTFVNRLGSRGQLLSVFFGIELFSVINFLLAAFLKRNSNYHWMALGLFFAVTGKDLLFFLPSPFAVAGGAVLLVGGTILFGNRTHIVYLWT